MKTSLVTGANRGIGLELARALARRGEAVVGVCRKSSVELDALAAESEDRVTVRAGVDVRDGASVRVLGEALEHDHLTIDHLVLNAGILRLEGLGAVDYESVREQLEVNAIAPLRMVEALRGRLRRGAKVAILTSRMGSMGDNNSGGAYGYRMSKAAVNAAGVSLARDLAADGVSVVLLHPGFVRTEMTGGRGNVDAAGAAAQLVERIDELTLPTSGRFVHANGELLPW